METTFEQAVEQHQLANAMFGPDDPRTIEAVYLVMLLSPPELFAEIEQMARSSFH